MAPKEENVMIIPTFFISLPAARTDPVIEAENPVTVEHDDEVADVHDSKDHGFEPLDHPVPYDRHKHPHIQHVD